MATAWFRICGSELAPDLSSCGGPGNHWLKRGGDSAKECAIDQFVLALPEDKFRILCSYGTSNQSCRRSDCRFIKVSGECMTIKKSMDLQTPHQVIGAGEFRDIGHVDV